LDEYSSSIAAINAKKTHCPQGHEFTPDNTYLTKKNQRNCNACNVMRARQRAKAKLNIII